MGLRLENNRQHHTTTGTSCHPKNCVPTLRFSSDQSQAVLATTLNQYHICKNLGTRPLQPL